jgi:hypothetical protein
MSCPVLSRSPWFTENKSNIINKFKDNNSVNCRHKMTFKHAILLFLTQVATENVFPFFPRSGFSSLLFPVLFRANFSIRCQLSLPIVTFSWMECQGKTNFSYNYTPFTIYPCLKTLKAHLISS